MPTPADNRGVSNARQTGSQVRAGRDVLPARFNSWTAKLILVAASVFVFCLCAEIGLRVFNAIHLRASVRESGAQGPYWAIYDPDLGYRLNPKWQDINADGLRDHPVTPKSSFRMLFLGDSIGFYGDSIDDTMVGHLRTALRQNPVYRDMDVLNGCVKGYTNYQEVLFLKKFGLKYQPDLVGVEFCLNDLHRFLHSFQMVNGQLVANSYGFSDEILKNRSWARRMAQHSQLALWVRDHLRIVQKVGAMQAQGGFSFDFNPDISPAWKDEPWKQIETQLGELVMLGRQHHFGVYVVCMPLGQQYRKDYLARDRNYVVKPQRKLGEICARFGIPYYDMYPDLNHDLMDGDDIHLNSQGRVVAGRLIANYLLNRQASLLAGATRLAMR